MFNFFKNSQDKIDISLLIQGPFNIECLKSIKSSKFKFKQIIYSTWENEKIDYSDFKDIDRFEIIIKGLPSTKNICNTANIYYQICSTVEGLKQVKTKYVMKHRSDESYNRLDLVIKKFNLEKLLCSNIYFRPIKYKAFHISDHFFIGSTARLLKTFTLLQEYLIKNQDHFNVLNNKCSVEQIIALFYLSTFGYKIEELLSKQKEEKFVFDIMQQYFDVFDVKHLKPYTIKHNHLNNTITDLKKADKQILIKYISNIKDIKS